MENKTEEIKKEFLSVGAKEKEAEELTFFSKNLSNLYGLERSNASKIEFLNSGNKINTLWVSKRAFAGVFLSVLLLLGFVSVVSAQGSLPGDPLYPVKRLSENVISIVDPSFRNEILKRRSEEIKALSSQNNSKNLQNTIDEYEKVLRQNKKINSQTINESINNLEDAQKNASLDDKGQIEKAIQQTDKFQNNLQKQEENVKGDRTFSPSPTINPDKSVGPGNSQMQKESNNINKELNNLSSPGD